MSAVLCLYIQGDYIEAYGMIYVNVGSTSIQGPCKRERFSNCK